jgi:hypothetical protein
MNNELKKAIGIVLDNGIVNYHPLDIVKVVNRLMPMGKQEALGVIEQFEQGQPLALESMCGLFIILRVLFDVPNVPGYHPIMNMGSSQPGPPIQFKSLPLFPVMMIEDLPIMMVTGYTLAGLPDSIGSHIQHFKKKGILRSTLLKPADGQSVTPDYIDRIMAKYILHYTDAYNHQPGAPEIQFVKKQSGLLRM